MKNCAFALVFYEIGPSLKLPPDPHIIGIMMTIFLMRF